jgi:hypothetical protein
VEMRGRMIVEIHPDDDAEEERDDGHLGRMLLVWWRIKGRGEPSTRGRTTPNLVHLVNCHRNPP